MTRRRGFAVIGPDGTIYSSQVAAGEALGVHPSTIRSHLDLYGDLSMLGATMTPCEWRGQSFPSIAALSRASGMSVPAIHHHLKAHGNLDRLGCGRRGRVGNRSKSKPVTVGPCQWQSRTALARDIGVSIRTITNWLSEDASPRQRERLMAFAMQRSTASEARTRARITADDAAADPARKKGAALAGIAATTLNEETHG